MCLGRFDNLTPVITTVVVVAVVVVVVSGRHHLALGPWIGNGSPTPFRLCWERRRRRKAGGLVGPGCCGRVQRLQHHTGRPFVRWFVRSFVRSLSVE